MAAANSNSKPVFAKIALRFKEPVANTLAHVDAAAAGNPDTVADRFAAVATLANEMVPDAFSARLGTAIAAATNAGEDVRRHLWVVLDDAFMTYSTISGFVETASKAAYAQTPTSGFADPASREAAAQAASEQVRTQNWANVRQSTVDKTKDTASRLATTWLDAIKTLAIEIQRCSAEYDFPDVLKERPGDLSDQFKVEALGKLYAGESLRVLVRDWNAIEETGDESRIRVFIQAAKPLCVVAIDAPATALEARSQGRQLGEYSADRDLAYRLRDDMNRWLRDARPASIDVAVQCLHLIRDAWSDVCGGGSARTWTRQEFFEAVLSTDASRVDDGLNLKLLSNWSARFIPGPGVVRLPGYTVPAGKSGMGAIVRSPPGRR